MRKRTSRSVERCKEGFPLRRIKTEGPPVRQRALQHELAALRLGDAAKLIEVLDPAFAVEADATAAPGAGPTGRAEAEAWAIRAISAAREAQLGESSASGEGSWHHCGSAREAVPGAAVQLCQWPDFSDGSDRRSRPSA